ncbi:MAG TPA: cysteine desulfurase family protein [Candidatus Paceibacterota bacterium]
MEGIYLDHASTTQIDPGVLGVMLPYLTGKFGNPSSMHAYGREAARAIDMARANVAKVIKSSPSEITFTGSGTEADNLAIFGVARTYADHGRHVIVSSVEHKAVLAAAKSLEKDGFQVTYLPVNLHGKVDLHALRRELRPETVLVSIMYANNEIGTIEPIREAAEIIADFRSAHPENRGLPLFHSDACQAAGALSLDVHALGVDLMSLSGSKIYGPKGVGCLYHRNGVRLEPLLVGGGQERGIRAGTEQVALIAGFAEALTHADARRDRENARMRRLRDHCISVITRTISGVILNGHPSDRLANNVHVSIPGIEGEAIVLMLDAYGIAASTGSACASNDLNPSHVLLAIGATPELAHGSVRFTLGRKTTKSQIDEACQRLAKIARRLRSISSIRTQQNSPLLQS